MATWAITVAQPSHLVVMTPCCSIEEKCLVLAPLSRIRPSFLKNPFLAEDLTRINRRVSPEQSLPPDAWTRMGPEEKAVRTAEGEALVFQDAFVFAPSPLLPPYRLDRQGGAVEMDHYMVDFKAVFRLESSLVARGKPLPEGLKILELSIESRQDLRDKVALFYGRVPAEDVPLS
jgi:hypothetical protein